MTVSFHKFGEFFPGTGDPRDIGVAEGKNYSVNFPLKDGINDESYESIFKPLISKIMEWYRPSAIVIQCGADSLAGDRLGCFNLTLKGHAMCVEFVKQYNLPTLVLGGGGYTIRNVARCWSYETSLLLGVELSNKLPNNDYLQYYGPDFKLHIEPSNMENLNSKEYLEKHLNQLMENLRSSEHAPSVEQFHRPPDHQMGEENDDRDPDIRKTAADSDKYIIDKNEYYDRDDALFDRQKNQIDYSAVGAPPASETTVPSDSSNQPISTDQQPNLPSESIPSAELETPAAQNNN